VDNDFRTVTGSNPAADGMVLISSSTLRRLASSQTSAVETVIKLARPNEF